MVHSFPTRRSSDLAEIVLGGHVRDRVVHEHRVERPPQPHRTHVALEVLALGVEPAAHVEHLRRAVDHGGHDGPDRALRYLEWTWDPDPNDSTVRMDLTYVFHEPDGSVHSQLDEHVCGLFPRATWLGLIREAGFEVRAVPLVHDERPVGAEGFLAVRPRSVSH